MNSEDQTKQLSESTRNLAKAVLIWGFQTFDTAQKISTQAQEFIQDLVEEARAEQSANRAKEQDEVEPQQKQPQSVTPEQDESVEPQQKKPQSVKKK